LKTSGGEDPNLRKRIIRLKFAREKIYEKPHLCRKTTEKIILEDWGQPGPEAICTQAAALQ